jgi:F5/8 type C domain
MQALTRWLPVLILATTPSLAVAQTWTITTVPRPTTYLQGINGSCMDPSDVDLTGIGFDGNGPVVGWSDKCQAHSDPAHADATNVNHNTNVRWIRRTSSGWSGVGVLPVPGGMTVVQRPGARFTVSPAGVPFYMFYAGENADDSAPHSYHAYVTDVTSGLATDVDGTKKNADGTFVHDVAGCFSCIPAPQMGLAFDAGGAFLSVRGIGGGGGDVGISGRLVKNGVSVAPPHTDSLHVYALDYSARAGTGGFGEAVAYEAYFLEAGTPRANLEVVHNGVLTVLPNQPLRMTSVSVAIDPAGAAHVAVAGYKTLDDCGPSCPEATPKVMYYTNASGSWTSPATIDLNSSTATIAVDSRGRPCIAYWRTGTDPAADGLRYSCAETTSTSVDYANWTSSTRIGTAFQLPNTGTARLAFDGHDSPHVLFFDGGTNEIMLASQDGTPPTTTASGADASWHNADVRVTLTARDPAPGTGVDRILYALVRDDGTRSPEVSLPLTTDANGNASGTVVVSAEGVNSVRFWAVDTVGNTEAENSVTVKIDKTKPLPPQATFTTISCSICTSPPYISDTWLRLGRVDSSVFTCADQTPAGVVNVSGIQAGTCPPRVSVTSEGITRFEFTTRDAAGNVSDPLVEIVKIDNTSPTLTRGTHPPAPPTSWTWNGAPWWNTDVTYTLQGCADPNPTSGSAAPGSVSYQPLASGLRPGTCSAPGTSATFTQEGVSWMSGMLDAIDYAGNSTTASSFVAIDKTRPRGVLGLALVPASGSTPANPSNGWYRSPVPVTVFLCYDPAPASNPNAPTSGIDPASNCYESASPYLTSPTLQTFAMTDGASRTFNGSALIKDKAGNPADPVTLTANVDSTPPVLSCSIAGTVQGSNRTFVGSIFGPDGANGGIESRVDEVLNLTANVAVTDNTSGLDGTAPYFWLDSTQVIDRDNTFNGYYFCRVDANELTGAVTGPTSSDTQFQARREACSTFGDRNRTYRFVYKARDRAGNVAARNCDFVVVPKPSGTSPTPVLLSVGATATQSSNYGVGQASKAVDGNTDGTYREGGADNSVTHTQGLPNSWWELDLGLPHLIDHVDLWNRTDCCPERLSNFDLMVSTDHVTWTSFFYRPTVGRPTSLGLGLRGRYVKIQLRGSDPLSLAEVQVWGN